KMATPIGAEYAMVQKRILDAANLTYRPLQEQQTLYIETADALRELGYATSQALDIQDSFTYLLTTNAASQEKGKNAIDAYTKSINSGRIEVDAWQSLLAATPTIIDAVSSATGKTTGEVRQLGITGKLSIADLNEGLRLSVERNKQLAAGMSTTVKDAVQRLSNTWQTYIGEANQANQSTAQIVKMVDMLSSNLDAVVKAATVAGEVMVAVWAVKAVGALKAYIAQLRQAAAETQALMASTTSAGTKMAAALSAAGKLALSAWVGWEIGTFLRSEFEVVEKAGIALAAGLTKGAAMVQGAWEMVQAAFTSDTIEAASARMEQRLQEIDAIYADMFANAGKAAQAQTNVAAATTAGGVAAENAKTKWEQYKSAFTTASEKLEQQRQQVDAMVALRNAEADGIARIAQELGTEKEARQAAADAAVVQSEQAKLQAEQASKELAAVRNHRDELAALGAEILKNDPIRQKELDALNTEVRVRESAAGQAIAHARALEVAAVAAKAEAVAVEDNSGKVKQLGEAYEQARQDLELLRNLQAAGIKTQQDVATAENALIKASKEYKDALSDQEGLIRARNSAEQSSFDLKSASVNLAIEQQRSILAVAKATGNEAMEMQAENNIRRLQIELLVLTAKAKDAEATAALASIAVKRAELIASGQLTEAKRLELDAATQAAKVKQMEAKIARETADGLERLGNVRKASKGDIDNEADALSRLNGERERELDNMVKRDNMGHETRTAGTSTGNRQGIIEWLKGAGLDEAVAEYISKDFVDANGKVAYMGNAGQKKWNGDTMSNALSNAVDYYKYGEGKHTAENIAAQDKAQKDAKDTKGKPTSSPAPAPSSSTTSASSGATYISNINIPGQATVSLNYSDAGSQRMGDELIRRLATGKGVAQ
ncbi:MAG: tape measure protein, partial [Comamonas sp.]